MGTQNEIINKVKQLPHQPGIYRYLNNQGKIIYIGKAKNLRKRVASYFTKGRGQSYRIKRLVANIANIEYTITNSEVEALLLENNLIKTHQPKYNILLKDGKTFPYICIKNERFPRVFSTRQKISDGSTYFGPYPSVSTMNAILSLIRGYIKIRSCSYHLSESNIAAGKFRRCLEYQIDNCAGPCEGLHSEADYNAGIEQVKHILQGNLGLVIRQLENLMKEAAAAYQFEKAEYYRKKIENVKAYRSRNRVVSGSSADLDVLSIEAEDHLAIVNHFRVKNGAIIQTHAWEIKRTHQEEESEMMVAAIEHLEDLSGGILGELVSHVQLDASQLPEGTKLVIPQKGDKKHLLDLSLKNCHTLLTEKLYKQNARQRNSAQWAMMESLQKELGLKELPDHIECFDNSNFQGNAPTASCVVFKNGKPSKRDYRKFNIKTVEGPNDFASMEEIVHRRYKRLLDEGQDLPKLIVIDGGKGQLSSAATSLKRLGLLDKIPIIGIAKRLEEIYAVGDPIPLHMDKKSPGLYLLQQARNEAHRFAINFHRQKRSKGPGQQSKIDQVKGIGPATAKKILREFKSIKKLKEASEEELVTKLGKQKAGVVLLAIKEGKI